jgi:penicillin-binding protein 1A
MASGYATFANGGTALEPTVLLQVVDRNGQILYEAKPTVTKKLDPWAVGTLNEILQRVVTSGTGTRAQLDDGRPVAGKTGTTSDFRDAWFIGYVPQLATAIWIGNDNNTPMAYGTAGGAYVAPTWKKFMTQALKNVPAESFKPSWNYRPPQPKY